MLFPPLKWPFSLEIRELDSKFNDSIEVIAMKQRISLSNKVKKNGIRMHGKRVANLRKAGVSSHTFAG